MLGTVGPLQQLTVLLGPAEIIGSGWPGYGEGGAGPGAVSWICNFYEAGGVLG